MKKTYEPPTIEEITVVSGSIMSESSDFANEKNDITEGMNTLLRDITTPQLNTTN